MSSFVAYDSSSRAVLIIGGDGEERVEFFLPVFFGLSLFRRQMMTLRLFWTFYSR